MITTIADLINAFIQKEVEMLDRQEIKHRPTIGDMYEGLTKEILERGIPGGLDLRVVSGFIINDSGVMSDQIDCMLVIGEGQNIPHTVDYIYHISKVLVVIEVKKNLYTNDLDSAYQNLISVANLHEGALPMNNLFEDACSLILRTNSDVFSDLAKLPLWQRELGKALYADSVTPVRIVLGYHGFASELSFRKAFIAYLEGKLHVGGYGASSLPNLIICDQYSIVKTNGMPYGVSLINSNKELYDKLGLVGPKETAPITENLWLLCASYPSNPILLLFELIWTRITYSQDVFVPDYGGSLQLEILRPVLLAKMIETENQIGWYYEYINLGQAALDSMPELIDWEPLEIDYGQFLIVRYLTEAENAGEKGLKVDLPELHEEIQKRGYSFDTSIAFLEENGIISVNDDLIRFLTREFKAVMLPGGKIVVGEDVSLRLTNWVNINYKKPS